MIMRDNRRADWEGLCHDISRMAATPFTPPWELVQRVGRYLTELGNETTYRGIWLGWNRLRDHELMADGQLYLRALVPSDDESYISTEPLSLCQLIEASAEGDEDEIRENVERIQASLDLLRARWKIAAGGVKPNAVERSA